MLKRRSMLAGIFCMIAAPRIARSAGTKIVWLGASTVKATDYGGVTFQQSFAYLTSLFWGYSPGDFVNAGVGGDDSGHMLARLSTDVIALTPKVCVVNAGGVNDVVNSVPIATYRSNVTAIFSQLQAAGIKIVAVNDVMKRWGKPGFATFQPYTDAFEEIAGQMEIPICDIYREYAISYIYEDYATVWNPRYAVTNGVVDDIHQSIAGNAWVASILSRPRYAGMFT